jgi:Zn-dependent protease
MRIRGIDVYVHWTVFLIAGLILLGALQSPGVSLVGLASYFGVLLIHEYGHLVAARRKGYEPVCIELYPVFGLARFEAPQSRMDRAFIAWGGVLAQAVIAVPLVAWVLVFGYTKFEAVNAALVLLGSFSLGMAVFNLLPIPPLDGSKAWDIIPAWIQRARLRRGNRPDSWTYRR